MSCLPLSHPPSAAKSPCRRLLAALFVSTVALAMGLARAAAPAPQLSTVDGIAVEWAAGGPDAAVTVVLESGTGEDMSVWRKPAEMLAVQMRVVAWHRPGVGRSTAEPDAPTVASHVYAFERAMKAAGAKPPYLIVAHASGAIWAEAYARSRPAAVRGLMFVDPAVWDQDELLSQHDRVAALQLAGLTKLWPGSLGRELRALSVVEKAVRAMPSHPGPLVALSPQRDTWGVHQGFLAARRQALVSQIEAYPRARVVSIDANALLLEEQPRQIADAVLKLMQDSSRSQ